MKIPFKLPKIREEYVSVFLGLIIVIIVFLLVYNYFESNPSVGGCL